MPYLPTVKAIAPNAPMGAKRIRMLTTPNTACVSASKRSTSGLQRGPDRRQREAEQDGDQQHLQDVALGEGVDHGGRDDVQQKIGDALRFGLAGVIGDGLGIERGGIDVEAARPA